MHSATISQPVIIDGRGLFSGQLCRAIIVPRYEGIGLTYFQNGDAIEAVPENFHEQPNCTVLSNGRCSVAVTEHLQAALWAAGIDSAEIYVTGPEIPNHDGGAATLYDIIASVPDESLGVHRPQFTLGETLEIHDGEDSFIRLSPCDELRIHYSFGHPELGEQQFVSELDRGMAVNELLPARTFITEREADQARHAGFLRNEHEEDALVIRNGIPSQPYFFSNEFARHKTLDLLGDLYILPFEWRAEITAHRSGHKLNRELARQLNRLFEASKTREQRR